MIHALKIALRNLRRSPGFVVTAIVTLALGIGVNAVVFSVLNAVVLRPLNVPQSKNLYLVQRMRYPTQSYPDYADLRDRNRTFSSLMGFNMIGPVGVTTGGSPSVAWPYLVTGNYFDAVGVRPRLGRFFHAEDEKGASSAPFVVLSYAYWRSHFGGDAGVVGRTMQVNKHPLTIIGVAPEGFRGTELFFAPALWIPMVEQQEVQGFNNQQYRGDHSLVVGGRLKPGVTPAQATADLNAIGTWLGKSYPADDDGLTFTLARPGLMGDMLGGPAKAFLAGLMLLAGMILLAACANLGSLFAARAADRAKEIAVRMALGSPRARVMRELLTEAVVVALAGGVFGLAGGIVVLRWLSAWQPIPNMPINVIVMPDAWTFVVAFVLALGSGLLFGMVPVRQVMRADPWQVIRTGEIAGGLRRFKMRDLLLAGQIAICAVLVTSSLVALRGMARSLHSNFGFVPDHVMLATTDVTWAGYRGDQVPIVQQKMLDAVSTIPGVTGAGYINSTPLDLGAGDSYVYKDATTDYRPTNYAADAMNYNVSPGYFAAAGTTMLAGRDITWHDDSKAPVVAVVNREFARKVFGSVDEAMGRYFKFWGGTRAQVVGVVEDGKYRTLAEDQQPAMFFPILQHGSSGMMLVVRSNRAPEEIAGAMQRQLHGVDAALPLTLSSWDRELATALFPARVATIALGILGFLGAMLAVTGIFGMASYVVSKRLRELGIRVALGAGQTEVLRAALGRAFRLLAIGSVAGLVLGVLAARVLAYIVYEATPKDPLVLGGVVATMLLVGLVAAWIPARRALAVDPMVLLREE
jgi:predicted permease